MDPNLWSLEFWTHDSENLRNLIWIIATVIGLPVLMIRALANHASGRAAISQAKTAERGNLADRFSTAITDLESDSESSRLGAIYALRALSMETDDLHWAIMDNLAAYVRRNRAIDASPAGAAPADIQQALSVLGSRPERYRSRDRARGWQLDLRSTDLSGVCLKRSNLSGADLSGTVICGADLSDAELIDADFSGAQLTGTNLRGARLTGTNLRQSDMRYCNLRQSCLSRANLWGADLTGSLIGDAKLTHSLMWGTTLCGASMIGVQAQGALLGEANLENAVVSRPELRGACLLGAKLSPPMVEEPGT